MKALAAKSRLSSVLKEGQRQRLSELMLLDVLDAFDDSGLLSQCYVVTASRKIRQLAERTGAIAVAESSDSGVNAAVETGLEHSHADNVMVVPSDLPLLKGTEVVRALSLRSADANAIITPSADFDGTNLLIYSRRRPVTLSFDRDSFWNHLSSAARLGLKVCVFSANGFRFDVDNIVHLRELARSRSEKRSAAFAKEALR